MIKICPSINKTISGSRRKTYNVNATRALCILCHTKVLFIRHFESNMLQNKIYSFTKYLHDWHFCNFKAAVKRVTYIQNAMIFLTRFLVVVDYFNSIK